MKIIMDSHEPPVMKELLEDAGFEVVVGPLPVSDYVVLDKDGRSKLYFSLKSNNDFIRSVYSNHLHNEIEAMLRLPDDMFTAVIVWKEKYIGGKGRSSAGVRIAVSERIQKINALYLPVFSTKDREGAVGVMKKWAKKLYDEELPVQYSRKVELAGDMKMDPVFKLYLNLPGVGMPGAQAIYDKYGSFGDFVIDIKNSCTYHKELYNTKKYWLSDVVWYRDLPIGEKSAKKIENMVLGDDYEPPTCHGCGALMVLDYQEDCRCETCGCRC